MALPVRQKFPPEGRTLTFDFSDKLAADDSLTGSPTVSGSSGITVSAVARSGNMITCRISGGDDQGDYVVSAICGTEGGDTLELRAIIKIRITDN